MAGFRLHDRHIPMVAPQAAFTFDGEPLVGCAGESIAAALTAAGKIAFGTRKDGTPRGLFCGMGVCHECLVEVDGEQNRRACMTKLVDGQVVRGQPYAGTAPADAIDQPAPEAPVLSDILVIGGGPAGLSAAVAAASCGATVSLLDERATLGGQYFKQLAATHRFADGRSADAQFRAGALLRGEVEALAQPGGPIRIFQDTMVWGAFAPDAIAAVGTAGGRLFSAQQLIVAAGAFERAVPRPGWTLPGVMTTGSAQTLQRAYRVSPGQRVIVAGNGPLNFQIAAALVADGVTVVAVVEAAPRPGLQHVRHLARATGHAPDLVRDGIVYLARLTARRVPILYGHRLMEATGTDRVDGAIVARLDVAGLPIPGSERRFAVDTVCLNDGFLPSNEIARALGCRHHHDSARRVLTIAADQDGRTSIDGVFVAGDCGVMGGARAAREQGFIAGCTAAAAAGHAVPPAIEQARAQSRDRLRRAQAFQTALWTIFAPAGPPPAPIGDTIACRCESVRCADLPANDIHHMGAIKRATRAGMGRCQGRYCGALLADRQAHPVDEMSFFAPRPPVRPVRIAAIARPPDDEVAE